MKIKVPSNPTGWTTIENHTPSCEIGIPLLKYCDCNTPQEPGSCSGTVTPSKVIQHVAHGTWPLHPWREGSEDEIPCFWARTEMVLCAVGLVEWCWPLPLWDPTDSKLEELSAPDPTLSLIPFRFDSTHAGDRLACIVVKSQTTPRKVNLGAGESTLFSWRSISTPTFSRGRAQHLDVVPSALPIEPVSANHLFSSAHGCLGVSKEPEHHPCTWWMCVEIELGRREELNTGIESPKVNLRNFLCSGSRHPLDLLSQTSPRICDTTNFRVSILNLYVQRVQFRHLRSRIACNPHPFWAQ